MAGKLLELLVSHPGRPPACSQFCRDPAQMSSEFQAPIAVGLGAASQLHRPDAITESRSNGNNVRKVVMRHRHDELFKLAGGSRGYAFGRNPEMLSAL